MQIKIVKKDLFTVSKEYALVQCISKDCKMGKGIAYEFNKRFPRMKYELIAFIKYKNINYPVSILYKGNYNIYNLVTKEKYFHKPTYDSLFKSIKMMKENIIKNDIKNIAMPKIGCGLDKLKWNKVYDRICQIFSDTDVNILICEV